MKYKISTFDTAEHFSAPNALDLPITLNANKTNFLLLKIPSDSEVRESIDEYGKIRFQEKWNELLAPATKSPEKINALAIHSHQLAHLKTDSVLRLFNARHTSELKNIVGQLDIAGQAAYINKLRPEFFWDFSIYADGRVDPLGYHFLSKTLYESHSVADFFERVVNALYMGLESPTDSLNADSVNYYQPRILEYLGLCVRNLWILFPFLTNGSTNTHVRSLVNPGNFKKIVDQAYSIKEIKIFREELGNLSLNAHTEFSLRAVERVIISSSLRKIEQVSTEFFARCLSISMNKGAERNIKTSVIKRAYNSLLLLRNSRVKDSYPQQLIVKDLPRTSLVEFSSFESFTSDRPDLEKWGRIMSLFIQEHVHATYSGRLRKISCDDFLDFLSQLKSAPDIKDIRRSHINNYTESGYCFRNYLIKKYVSNDTRNTKISDIETFFSFAIERLRVEEKEGDREYSQIKNPVDLIFDRFKITYRAGSTRKSISPKIISELKNILVDNDYEWPKTLKDWGHLVNKETQQLEYVWCPSAAICLYLLLSVPLRGLQARMLDSGEGDAEIFDFESGKMIRNKYQLPVDGILSKTRCEGFIQIVPSGIPEEPEIVGLWITVEKTSDFGRAIPYVSDDLIKHLKFQREWIFRYAADPNMQSIDDAQGYRSSPQEWVDRQDKFYCLFRDPTAERLPDRSLPVSRSKMLHLWGRLCHEAERRKNSEPVEGRGRLKLVKEGTENLRRPLAKHDLHSLRVSGLTDLLDRGVPLGIVSEYVAGHKTYMMTLWYDKPAPGAVRHALMEASKNIGNENGALPRFTEEEIEEMKPFLLSNPNYEGAYTGFDALNENAGLIQVREDGICPGSRCEEGGLDEHKRIAPVPVGDRGPSCPQCRFYLTGPAFLLGQTIRGNELILKIRSKVDSIASSREQIMAAEDSGQARLADLLRDKNDREERQLNNMLTEWWHRMRFYESSVRKLDEYQNIQHQKQTYQPFDGEPIALFKQRPQNPAQYGFAEASMLEITHFMSTCTELLPSFEEDALKSHLDIEIAVGKFLSLNDKSDLNTTFFKLDDKQRLSTANLLIDLLLHLSNSPLHAKEILEGKFSAANIPSLSSGINNLFNTVQKINSVKQVKK